MNNINVPNEIENVKNKIFYLDTFLLDAAREEVKRKANIKSMTAKVLLGAIFAVLLFYLMLTVSSFLKLILGILCLFGLEGFSAGIISDIINESRKKKLNDIDELRRISEKLANKNPELARKISDKNEQERILVYLNEKSATNKRENETKFTSIEPITQGKLLGPQELVDVLTLIRKKKEKNQ